MEDEPLVLLEELHGIPLLLAGGYLKDNNERVRKWFGEYFADVFVFRKSVGEFWYPRKYFLKVGKKVFEKIRKDEEFRKFLNRETREQIIALNKFSDSLPSKGVENFSKEEVAHWFDEFNEKFRKAHSTGQIEQLMEIEGNYLTNFLIDALSQAIGKKGVSIGVQEAFSLLTTPTEPTSLAIEEGALAALAKEIAADREARNVIMNCGEKELENRITNSGNPLLKKLVAHWREYAWILFNFVGPEAPLSYFANKAREQITKGERVSEEKNTLKNKEMLLRELQLDSESERLFDYAREIVWLKGERKNAMYRICWRMEPLVREACKRMDINRELFNALFPWEVGEFLRKGLPKKEIELRSKFMVMDGRKGGEEVLVGEAASSFYARLCVRKTTDEKELRGTCASIGPIVRGRVKIINKPSDMHKMSEGDVLVSFQTDPNLVPAMKKAAAIVTEAGGLTCHAAIVSREMRLPCVVGVKHVTSSLKDGEMVEVDAKLGIVRRLKDSDVH